jgi:threonine aldolase
MKPIDLRSDTVTRPTAAMRAAMAAAEVGDDQYGEDPTTNRLQALCAERLGKEAALWMPSGTMSNQVALRVLTRPGDEVVASREAHASWHEAGAAAANAGVQIVEVGERGVFTRKQFEAAIKPQGLPVFPPTTLVEIENTHNRAGGVVVPQDEVVRICAAARARGIASFLDGARLWNASVATGRSPRDLCAPFDMVSVCFSKGLGAPAGGVAGVGASVRANGPDGRGGVRRTGRSRRRAPTSPARGIPSRRTSSTTDSVSASTSLAASSRTRVSLPVQRLTSRSSPATRARHVASSAGTSGGFAADRRPRTARR